MHKSIAYTIVLFFLASISRAAEPIEIPILPGEPAPGAVAAEKTSERGKEGKHDRSTSNVRWPTVTVYLPDKEKATGAAIIICPGGGYGGLAIDKEGHDVAKWLNSVGVAGLVLKYRLPRPAETKEALPWPITDARRAIQTARLHAKEWNLNVDRIGVMGFSAGGHLAATTATQFADAAPDSKDPVEHFSSRPNFAVLVYPVITFTTPATHTGSKNNLLGKDSDAKLAEKYSAELQVTDKTPPTLLVHAKDDGVKIANSELFRDACKKAGVPVELLAFEKGGHGFGLGVRGGEPAAWPGKCAEWMKGQGLLK